LQKIDLGEIDAGFNSDKADIASPAWVSPV